MPTAEQSSARVVLLTPPGEGGISVLRLAGPAADEVLRRAFRTARGRPPDHLEPDRLYYGTIVDAGGRMLDEVILHYRPGEAELNCHGGRLVTRRVVERLVELGAEEVAEPPCPAARGSVEEEAWQALVAAPTGVAAAVFLDQYHGALRGAVEGVLADLAAGRTRAAGEGLARLLAGARFGLRLAGPPRAAIVGRPNVGKSTLLNALLGRERALVDARPGTTRDYLDAPAACRGLPVIFLDTAGLGASRDPVEREGVRRAREQARRADLVLAVLAGSEPLQPADRALARELRSRPRLPVVSKADLPRVLDEEEVRALFGCRPVRVSALTGEGLETLEERLAAELFGPVPPPGGAVVFTQRQRDALDRARKALADDPREACRILRELVPGEGRTAGAPGAEASPTGAGGIG